MREKDLLIHQLKLPLNKLSLSIFAATVAFILIWLLPLQLEGRELHQYAPLHTILEMVSVVVAGSIFSVGWHARREHDNHDLTLLAVGFLGVAMLDLAHALSFAGMPDWVTPSGSGKAIYFWFLARYLAAVTLLIFVLCSHAQNIRFHSGLDKLILAAIIAVVALSIWIVLWHRDWLPDFIVPGQGLTPLKIYIEWILSTLVLGVMVLVWRQPQNHLLYDRNTLLASLWLTILSELCFTLYSEVNDLFNLMGHFYKVLSYVLLYQSIVRAGIRYPYKLLSQSQETLQQLTDHIRKIFWISTPDKKTMLYINPAYEKIWQRPLQEMLEDPLTWTKSVHPDDKQRVIDYLETQSEEESEIDYRIVLPDGSIRHIHSNSFPIFNDDGVPYRIAGVVEDVTEQVLDQERLVRNERLLQQSQAITHIGSWEYEIEKDQLLWSDEVYRIFGISPETFDASYESFLARIHPDDRLFVDSTYRSSLINNEDNYEVEHRILRPGTNEIRFVYEKCYHIRNKDGKAIRSIGIVHDITDRKSSELEQDNLKKQLLQAQKMEAIGHLTGGIAHDFNNMLGAILGYAELLIMKCTPCEGPQRRYIDEIIVAGNRAKELIAQMLVFSRLRPEAETEVEIFIKPIISEVIQLLRLSIPTTIELNYRIASDDLKIYINPVQLHQIILNLVINARDACGEYGKIDINIEQKHAHENCDSCHQDFDGEYIVISVSDTGSGIKDELRGKIFDPFFTTKEVGKGTGMGLSVVHGMVHNHHGHILVKNRDDQQGTIFQILLPVERVENKILSTSTQALDSKKEHDLSNLQVMVIDDEPAVANFISEILMLNGATVSTFTDSEEALGQFTQTPDQYDVVITDETMPRISGIDLAQHLLQLKPKLPIILCTGYSERVNDEVIKQVGITHLLYKPVTGIELINLICQVVQCP